MQILDEVSQKAHHRNLEDWTLKSNREMWRDLFQSQGIIQVLGWSWLYALVRSSFYY